MLYMPYINLDSLTDNQILAIVCIIFAAMLLVLTYLVGWIGSNVIDRYFKALPEEMSCSGVYRSESMNAKLVAAKEYVSQRVKRDYQS